MTTKRIPHQKYTNKDGIEVPGTTAIISSLGWNREMLVGWANKVGLEGKNCRDIKDDAADLGTLVHKYLQNYITNGGIEDELNELRTHADMRSIVICERALERYKTFEVELGLKNRLTEYQFVNEEYQYGGTIDLIAGNVLCDFKTSKYVSIEHIIQLAAYYHGVKDQFNFDKFYIFHIRKDFDSTKENEDIITAIPISLEYLELMWEVFISLIPAHVRKKEALKRLKEIPGSYEWIRAHKPKDVEEVTE